jgi:uncharacterized protein
MIRRVFKKKNRTSSSKIAQLIEKYRIPREFLSINRRSVSRGVYVGLFWAFIPMPLQMLAVLATTPLFRFNVPLAISMVWLSNPLTMPLMYYVEYLTGNFILGREGIDTIELKLEWFVANWDTIVVPLYIGTAFYSVVFSGVVYLLVNRLWVLSVKTEKRLKLALRRNQSLKSANNTNTKSYPNDEDGSTASP